MVQATKSCRASIDMWTVILKLGCNIMYVHVCTEPTELTLRTGGCSHTQLGSIQQTCKAPSIGTAPASLTLFVCSVDFARFCSTHVYTGRTYHWASEQETPLGQLVSPPHWSYELSINPPHCLRGAAKKTKSLGHKLQRCRRHDFVHNRQAEMNSSKQSGTGGHQLWAREWAREF